MIDEDEPERNPSAGIEPNVPVWDIVEWTHRKYSNYSAR
jgi:hypothetical protein